MYVDKNQPYGCVIIVGPHKIHYISSLDHSDSELLLMQELSHIYAQHVLMEVKRRIMTTLNIP